jgi:hypothetical protein
MRISVNRRKSNHRQHDRIWNGYAQMALSNVVSVFSRARRHTLLLLLLELRQVQSAEESLCIGTFASAFFFGKFHHFAV